MLSRRLDFQILPGNTNTYAVANNTLSPPIFASKVRFVPHSDHLRTVCMRLELVGCRFLGKKQKNVIIKYFSPSFVVSFLYPV